MAAAEHLGYHPNLNARRLASNRSFLIGLLYDNPQSEYATGIQDGAIQTCRKKGYHLLIQPVKVEAPGMIDDVVSIFRQSTVDGFILIQPVSEHFGLIQTLKEKRIPFVNISQRGDAEASVISVDDSQAAYTMTEYLIGQGHQRIGFIMGHPEHSSSHDRLNGYRRAMLDYGCKVNDQWIEQGFYDFESGYACAGRLLDLKERPSAIFASNDHMAMGVLTAAHEREIAIPGELSVCGYDDFSLARYVWPSLTTLHQPIIELGRIAADMLIDQLTTGDGLPKQVTLHSELIKRNSTGDSIAPLSS